MRSEVDSSVRDPRDPLLVSGQLPPHTSSTVLVSALVGCHHPEHSAIQISIRKSLIPDNLPDQINLPMIYDE